jgi:hypothetical protein
LQVEMRRMAQLQGLTKLKLDGDRGERCPIERPKTWSSFVGSVTAD